MSFSIGVGVRLARGARRDGRDGRGRARRAGEPARAADVAPRADAHAHSLRGSVAAVPAAGDRAVLLLLRRADHGLGRPADLPAVGAQCRLRRAAGAGDLGGHRATCSAARRASRRAAFSRRARRATTASPRPGSWRGAACWRWSPRAWCRGADHSAVRAGRLRDGHHRPVARPDRAQCHAQGRGGPRLRLRVFGARPRRDARPVWFGLMLDHRLGRARCSSSSPRCWWSRSAPCCRCAAARVTRANYRKEHSMDLGIAGRRALVCAASKGLGTRLRRGAGARRRRRDDRRAHRADVRARRRRKSARWPGARWRWVACDITTAEGRAAALAACPAARHPRQQRRRPAAGRFPRLGPRRLAARASTPTC